MLLTLNHIGYIGYTSCKLKMKASYIGSKKCNPERIISTKQLLHIIDDLLFEIKNKSMPFSLFRDS